MNGRLGFYDPYTYQPKVAGYFMGRPFPSEIAKVAANNPQAANHIMSLWQFTVWLNQQTPELYNAVKVQNPALLDPSSVILMGKLNAPVLYGTPAKAPVLTSTSAGRTQVAGLRALADDTTASDTVTEWGKSISDILTKYAAYDQQKKLIDLNIKRAEQGQPPITAEQYAAGVQFGMSPSMQQFAYIALGGLVIVGLLSAFARRRA